MVRKITVPRREKKMERDWFVVEEERRRFRENPAPPLHPRYIRSKEDVENHPAIPEADKKKILALYQPSIEKSVKFASAIVQVGNVLYDFTVANGGEAYLAQMLRHFNDGELDFSEERTRIFNTYNVQSDYEKQIEYTAEDTAHNYYKYLFSDEAAKYMASGWREILHGRMSSMR